MSLTLFLISLWHIAFHFQPLSSYHRTIFDDYEKLCFGFHVVVEAITDLASLFDAFGCPLLYDKA